MTEPSQMHLRRWKTMSNSTNLYRSTRPRTVIGQSNITMQMISRDTYRYEASRHGLRIGHRQIDNISRVEWSRWADGVVVSRQVAEKNNLRVMGRGKDSSSAGEAIQSSQKERPSNHSHSGLQCDCTLGFWAAPACHRSISGSGRDQPPLLVQMEVVDYRV